LGPSAGAVRAEVWFRRAAKSPLEPEGGLALLGAGSTRAVEGGVMGCDVI
jgi:hypothetical protein